MDKITPEQLAKQAHDSQELVFSHYLSGTTKQKRYVTPKPGKKK